MARTSPKQIGTGKRVIGPKTRFAPDLLALEDRSVPAFIYVDPAFAGSNAGSTPIVDFNAGGAGPLGTVSKAQLTFVTSPAAVTGTEGKFATTDITLAFNAARDNPGADTILLAASNGTYDLDNSQGKSTLNGGFNDNTYFFNTDPLSILGSGKDLSKVRPTVSTVDPLDPATKSDPVFAVRQGADFVGSDFTLDGALGTIGVGIGVSGGTDVTLTRVTIRNFVAVDGSTTGGATFGFGVSVNPNAGGFVSVQDSLFTGNARAGVSVLNSNAQVLGTTFTGRGAGDLVDYGVQAIGTSNVYVSGSTFSGYTGKASGDGTESAAIFGSQDFDTTTGTPIDGGASLLVVGNSITGNRLGVILGNSVVNTNEQSKAVVNYNDLSGNTSAALNAISSQFGPAVVTGQTSGIDGRFNFFGGTGPNRQATTGSNGDELINPTGTGSKADGNVRISNFRSVTVAATTVANPTFVADPAGLTAAANAAAAKFNSALTPAKLIIYVNGTNAGTNNAFVDANADGKADQAFNPTGTGPLGTQPAGSITFVASNTPYGTFTVPADGKIAVPDLTTAFDLARDNPGADTIFLAASDTPFVLNNANGASDRVGGGFNPNSYFFNNNPLTLAGSGLANSVVRPTASTYNPNDPATNFDPVFAVRQGGTLTGTDFSMDGITAKFGGGIGVSGASNVTLNKVGLRNFVAEDGSKTAGGTTGYGIYLNNNTTGVVSISNGQFSGNGRVGVGLINSNAQVFSSIFTGRGAGDLVDYGVQALGTSNVLVTGSTLTGYQGKASIDGTVSAALFASEDSDPATGTPIPGAANLLAVGNSITGNRVAIAVGSSTVANSASKAEVRFNDLSNNQLALDASQGVAGPTVSINAPNNYFGDPVGPTGSGSKVAANAGNVKVSDIRVVTAPTLSLAQLTFGGTAANSTDLAAAGTAAGAAYVIDPRVQSEVFLTGTSPAAGKDLVVTVNYTDPLAKTAAGTAYNFDPSLIGVTFTNTAGTTTTLTAAQFTVTPPDPAGTGKTATVTVTAATLASLGPVGVITVTGAPSSGSAGTGNAQLTANGFQTGGPNALGVPFGAVNGGPDITPNAPAGVTVTPSTPATSTFAVTVAPGRTIASVTAASSNAAVTVTRVAGSPDSAPQFQVSSTSTAVGSATVTVTATDSDGLTDSTAFNVAFGVANTGVALTPIGNLTFNTNGPAQNASTTVTYSPGRTGTVTFSVSPNNLVTVTQGGTSTNPTFTVTPVAGAVGSGVVTIRATDSDGITNSTAFSVQVGTGVAPTITGLPDATIPFNGSTGPLTVNIAGANAPLTVTGTSSNTGVATVAVTGSGNTRTVVVTANPALTTGGSTAISLRVTDAQGNSTVESFNITVAPQRTRLFAAGVGPGESPVVQVYGQNGVKLFGFTAFELSFTGGVSVATGDVNADGVDDIIAGASIGGGPRVRVIDGKTGMELANFFAFESSARTGVNVAVGKLVSDGNAANASGFFREQIIVGSAEGGGPRVSSFDILPGQGANPTRINNFFAYEDTFRNGATVAAADLTGDGIAEIVTGSGNGGGPRVRSFTAAGAPAGLDFFAYDSGLRTGISVAAGQLDGTGKASIVVGSGANGQSLVRVFSSTGTQTSQFTAYADTLAASVRVGTAQFNANGPESIVTGPGVGGGPLVKVFTASNPGGGSVFSDFSFEQPFRGGIFVG